VSPCPHSSLGSSSGEGCEGTQHRSTRGGGGGGGGVILQSGPSLGPGQTEWCDLPPFSAEAAHPRRNSGLKTATVLGKSNYLL